MKTVKTLHSFEAGEISETEYELPPMQSNQIKVRTIYCGVCRSDIGSYNRWEDMPYGGEVGGFGHEGLGEVVAVGSDITGVENGDIVSTISDPAYADYYYANQNEFIVVPEVSPKYILQPTACAVNIAVKTSRMMQKIFDMGPPRKILLIGSGFMSFIVVDTLNDLNDYEFQVLGSSHKERWKEKYDTDLISWDDVDENEYDVIIDLSSKAENYEKIIRACRVEGLICYASTPYTPVTTNFFETCWKCHTWIFPSPRNNDFIWVMDATKIAIEKGVITDLDELWTKGYDRKNMDEVKQAFEDGTNRTPNYIRGYITYE